MSSVFLFGAGASYGSGPCLPYSPPLGAKFFEALRKEPGIAATVDAELAKEFCVDFEKGMDRFWLERNTDVSELLRDMALYFTRFQPQPGNYYLKLIEALGGTRKRATLVTTNYDLLLEHAITRSGLMISYGGLPAPEKNIPLLKIHGSCNFLPDTGGAQFSRVGFDMTNSNGSILEANVRVAISTQEVIDFCRSPTSLAPAIAMYSPDKRVLYCKDFVIAQQQAWRESLTTASRIYVIGLKVHTVDEHIWEPLAKAKGRLYYVGFEPEDFNRWTVMNGRKNAFVLAKEFGEAIPLIADHLGTKLKSNDYGDWSSPQHPSPFQPR